MEIHSLQDKGMKLTAIQQALRKGGEPARFYEREVLIRHKVSEGIEIQVSKELEEKKRKEIADVIRLARRILEGGDSDE